MLDPLALLKRLRDRQVRSAPPGIQHTRELILFWIVLAAALVGSIAYLPSVLVAWRHGFHDTVAVDTLVYGWAIWLLFGGALSYRQRALSLVLPIWLLGVYLLVRFGTNGAGLLWLFAVPLLSGLLLGARAGLAALALNTFAVVGLWIAILKGAPPLPDPTGHPLALWAVMGGNFILLDTLLTISVVAMLRGLDQALSRIATQAEELALTKDATIETVASLAEFRDADTGYHIRRTKSYVEELAGCLAERPGSGLGADFVELLTKSAPLHDIGKIGVPDQILCKPGRLTPEEYEVMKRHATIGRDALLRSERQLGSNGFLRLAAEVAYSHQERWDGSGYPLGLKGDAIPLSGRIMAVADVYDALISRRPYKQPVDHESAVAYIQSNRGRLFDPQVVDALVERAERFRAIAARYADAQPALEPAPPSAERPADAPQAQTQGRHV